ncbi:hypothetical protein N6H18_16850 [Reichenbachiella agarivorans]|uniref:Mannosyl-glycoprotein endo-beta-N-acetylglucosaminidase n=1 Tax=Reichenbachiella agarivorans TaxID=2979464 RepID=A0ABY6CNB7_9BACT|nr:hypothetical protein [Reichenbachiella agarivorans]UXP32013.1 hypothetical protein N6H18_16850 [Reichenbachiella agarivorans]
MKYSSLRILFIILLICFFLPESPINSANQRMVSASLLTAGLGTESNTEITKTKHTSKLPSSKKITNYRLRKYRHVTQMMHDLSPATIELCVKNKVPPAAILSIISLESGWGSGYVGQITGNIMSLNAGKKSTKLPPLYLPEVIETGKILFDEVEIKKYDPEQLEYKMRSASMKRDYRPKSIAGTSKDLNYFKYHPKERVDAQMRCINDFIQRFVSYRSSIPAYREARANMDAYVKTHGVSILFDPTVNVEFIHTIGGRPNSFNYHEEWPLKVENIMNGVGLVELSRDMYLNHKTFNQSW